MSEDLEPRKRQGSMSQVKAWFVRPTTIRVAFAVIRIVGLVLRIISLIF